MTDPVPILATNATTAAEEYAEVVAFIAKHHERAAELRDRLAAEPINALGRRKLRADIAEAEAAIEDGEEAKAALRPRLDAERAQALFEQGRASFEEALASLDATLAGQAHQFDDLASRLVRLIGVIAENARRVALRAGYREPPLALVQPLSDLQARLADIVLGKLFVADLLREADLPERYMDAAALAPGLQMTAITPSTVLAAADSAAHAVRALRRAIASQPPVHPALAAQEAIDRAARAAAAEEAPLPPRGSMPPPLAYTVAPAGTRGWQSAPPTRGAGPQRGRS